MNHVEAAIPKPIVARDQVRLGLARCWQLAVSGMSYRMFRSMVTTAILALAAAFLVHMLGFGLMENATERVAFEKTQQHRRVGQDLLRLTKPDPPKAVLAALETDDATRLEEYATWGELGAAEVEQARATARSLGRASEYFANLATAPKAVIVGDRSIDELLDYLAEPPNFARFELHSSQFALRPPLDDMSTFRAVLVEQRPRLQAILTRIQVGQERAIARISAEIGSPVSAILEQPLEVVQRALHAAGYTESTERLAEMREFALRGRDRKSLERTLLQPHVLGAVARRFSVEPRDVNFERLVGWIDSSKQATWLHSVLKDGNASPIPTPERIDLVFSEYRQQRQFHRVAGDHGPSAGRGIFGLSPRSQWLIVLSFLVCMVGVANAMLMSVTERFTEIATMKCLGALDRFVMSMFVLEALIQGAVGGAVGLVLGILLAILRGFLEFGPLLGLATGAASTILLAMLASLVATMVLAALSAVGPAYVAARLSPMEAMRVE